MKTRKVERYWDGTTPAGRRGGRGGAPAARQIARPAAVGSGAGVN
jgi:hypothetical protein